MKGFVNGSLTLVMLQSFINTMQQQPIGVHINLVKKKLLTAQENACHCYGVYVTDFQNA